MRMIRKNDKTSDGWNHADIDVALQLFRCGMVWDGNLCSKDARDHLVEHGYVVRSDGMQSLTGKGIVHFLTTPRMLKSLFIHWRRGRGLYAGPLEIRRAMRG